MMMQKEENRPWVVQKYGGTSVGKLLPTITGKIIPEYLLTCNVVVVCSAISGSTKSAGTTSLLLKALASAISKDVLVMKTLDEIIGTIKINHLEYASSLQAPDENNLELISDLRNDIEKDCEDLKSFLYAIRTIGEVSERAKDRVLAVGERLSCRIVAAALISQGTEAELVSLEDVVQETYGQNVLQQCTMFKRSPAKFLSGLSRTIQTRINQCNGKLPVVTGFFGSMPNSLVECVGRGYSDLCGALCAFSVNADTLEIWKEVDGIFTADPTKIPSARVLAAVTSEEASELTHFGSEVIHPLTTGLLGAANINFRLKNVKNPSAAGTIIYPPRSQSPDGDSSSDSRGSSPHPVQMAANGYYGVEWQRRVPTAITIKDSVTLLNIVSSGQVPTQALLGYVEEILSRHAITIDLISCSNQALSLAVSSRGSPSKASNVDEAVAELREISSVTVTKDTCILSVIGHKMRNMVGVASEIFSALAGARINIYLISQGASEINISFVVRKQDGLLAMDVVHSQVMKIPGHTEQEAMMMKGPWLF